MVVCVRKMGLKPCCWTPPAQAEAGVWTGARRSEPIFTITFVLWGSSVRKSCGLVPAFALPCAAPPLSTASLFFYTLTPFCSLGLSNFRSLWRTEVCLMMHVGLCVRLCPHSPDYDRNFEDFNVSTCQTGVRNSFVSKEDLMKLFKSPME